MPPISLIDKRKTRLCFTELNTLYFFWIPGVIHAVLVIGAQDRDRQNKRIIDAIKNQNK
jgi:uncharacterized membrane protein YqaE (UPF0057 family)